MHTQRTRDRLSLSPEEVQKVLRDYIEKESGRKISGEIRFQTVEMMAGIFKTVAHVDLQYPEGEEDDE